MTDNSRQINQLLEKYYGLSIQHIERLPFGADNNAEVFKATSHDQSYFVKVKHEVQDDIHLELLNILKDAGIKEIIFPLYASNPELLVYPFVDADNGFIQPLSDQQWRMLGAALRRIHEIDIPVEFRHRLRLESFSNQWRRQIRDLCHSVDKINAFDDASNDFKSYLIDHVESILCLLGKSEALSSTINKDESQYVLCHADIHAGNVLLAGEEVLYIVDWDNPILAPKERDLMFIGAGVGNVWNKPNEVEFFYDGYGKTDIDHNMISYYRCERILEDIVLYAEAIFSKKIAMNDKLIMFQHVKDMFVKNGVVEIASRVG